jgi:C-terminal processing protease CtpA/Prc
MRDFIRMAKAQGKTKMIFDMRGNGGGKRQPSCKLNVEPRTNVSYR